MAKVVIFSGAGISAESGISTFRDSGGLWDEYDIKEICYAGCLEWNYDKTIEFYDKRRSELKEKHPNDAHKKICALANKYPNEIAIITQNVDDMFERAGCQKTIHLHGFLPEVRCMQCGKIKNIGYEKLALLNKRCSCGGKFRPNIVFFAEAAPMYAVLEKELQDCEMVVVIGTSGNVIGVNAMAAYRKAILNNLEPSAMIEEELFDTILYKKATEAIDEIVQEVEAFLKTQK